MGQYYLVVNKTKREYLYPHLFNDGLKAVEILWNGNTLKALGVLLLKSDGGGGGDLKAQNDENNPIVGRWAGDDITIIGDYDSSNLYTEADEYYTDISMHVINLLTDEGVFDVPGKNQWVKTIRDRHTPYPDLPKLKSAPGREEKEQPTKKESVNNFFIEVEE